MPSRLISTLILNALELRAFTIIPLQNSWRRLRIALSSGAKRTERQADAAWRLGHGLAAKRYWEELERAQPTNARWPTKIANVKKERGDIAGAERVLLDARDRGIKSEEVELGLLRYGRLCRLSNAALEDAEAVVADPGASISRVFFSAFYLTAHNRLESARRGFERTLGDTGYGPLARGQLAVLDLLVQNRAHGKPDIPGWVSSAQSSVLIREPSSDTLVVVFALPEGALGLPMNAIHAMLSPKGVNALFLYDSRQLYHLAGTDRFGPGYPAMLDGIRALAAELGTRRLITVGGSATGYTALRTAMDLEAEGALVFSAQTLMLPRANPGNARNAHTLLRLRENVLPMMNDLRQLLMAHKHAPHVEFYYSGSNRRDLMHAENLAGLPGVALHPIRTRGRHDCVSAMAALGYRDLLDRFAAR
ncbi:MAG TPA: hypothetical protein VII56_06890 [Rhizomicrobium sp.]